MSYLRQPEQVEDAMQNTYLKAFLHLRAFQGGASFSTWLTRIMINECLMLIRRQKKARMIFAEEEMEPATPNVHHHHAAAHTHLNEMKVLLEHSVARLPERQRVVYMLREIQHLSTEETAGCLGISCESVKVRLHRARALLKEDLLGSAAGVELFPYHASRCRGLTARVMTAILAAV
jgi:RNA polymerase sigma factor (sigma-70 family)